MKAEEWLAKLDKHDGDPNGIFTSSSGTGLYIAINPYKPGCTKDADVTAFRHALVEFDEGLSPAEQFKLYMDSKLPCSAIIYSGGKSVHAWVLVEATSRQEYDERVKTLYAYFSDKGLTIDGKNKNPGRLSRLPGCRRFERRQELLAGRCGAANFGSWLADREVEGLGKTALPDELMAFDYRNDPSRLMGQRYLCRGGSLVMIGPSGVGKSSLLMQLCVSLAVGQPFFGIQQAGPGKVLFIQAENDFGDMAEMFQGVMAGLEINDFVDDGRLDLVRKNMVFQQDCVHTGWSFVQVAQKLIEKHKPTYVAVDPLLSFVGADMSKQEVCSQFLRNWLNPISESTGVIWLLAHHTGKPNAKARQEWSSYDFAYSGLGSSELVNWARAIMVLEPTADQTFRLRLSKRGGRAGAKHPDGNPTVDLFLKHAQHGIHWEQVLPPALSDKPKAKRGPDAAWPEAYAVLGDGPANLVSIFGSGLIRARALEAIVQFVCNKSHDIKPGIGVAVLEKLVKEKRIEKAGRLYRPVVEVGFS